MSHNKLMRTWVLNIQCSFSWLRVSDNLPSELQFYIVFQFHHDIQKVHGIQIKLLPQPDIVINIREIFINRYFRNDIYNFCLRA